MSFQQNKEKLKKQFIVMSENSWKIQNADYSLDKPRERGEGPQMVRMEIRKKNNVIFILSLFFFLFTPKEKYSLFFFSEENKIQKVRIKIKKIS